MNTVIATSIRRAALMLLCGVCLPVGAFADEKATEPAGESTAAAEEEPQGILPIPDYGGDIWTRRYLTGNWTGTRDTLAGEGIQLNVEYFQYMQAVADGGVDKGDEWGGKAVYQLHLDLQKMGILPGALVYVRFDSRWGDGTLGKTGQLLPANEAFLIPVDYTDLERETWGALTAFNYTQFLHPKFGVFAGKLDMMDGDPNEFAGGRGDTQFMNYSLMFAAPTAIVPASTIGAGAIFIPNEHIILASQVVSATDSTFDSLGDAIDDWSDGQIWATALMTQFRVLDLPGGFNATYLQWFNAELTDIGSIAGALTSNEDESWLIALSAWQYLYTEESSEGPLDTSNKIPDLQGVGLFARLGFADDDTNPFNQNVSVGVGGRGVIPGRDNDLVGAGYFYTETKSSNVVTDTGTDDNGSGFEMFYNLAITPAAMLALDFQWLEETVSGADDAVVLGTRVHLKF